MVGWFPLSETQVWEHTWRGWPGTYRLRRSRALVLLAN